jgi:hypothetical protein
MLTPSPADCELTVVRTLAVIREQLEHALDDTSANGNAFAVHNKQLRADQVRRLVVSTGPGRFWTMRDGRHCLASADEIQRSEVSMFVGGNRFLTAAQVFLILSDLVADKPGRGTESQVAALVNLLVVEPKFYPERELAIWLTVVQSLLTQHVDDDLHEMLPDLMSAFDVLHHELPATGEYADAIRPRPERPGAIPWPVYEMKLFAEIRPDLAGAIAAATDDAARAKLWAAHTPELRNYIRAQFFVPMAEAIAAAKGRYAELPWDADD